MIIPGKALLALGVATLCLSSAAAPCRAGTIVLNQANPDLAKIGPGPYGTVVISDPVKNQVTVTFTAAAPYLFFGNTALGLSVHSTNFTVTNLTKSLTAGIDTKKGKNISQFGDFDLVINGDKSTAYSTFSFTLTNLDPKVTWAQWADVVIGDDKGFLAAGHAKVLGNGNTGFAGGSGGGVVPQSAAPEPSAVALFGVGAAGLAGYAWRRRKPVA
jgi:hypothetical protein